MHINDLVDYEPGREYTVYLVGGTSFRGTLLQHVKGHHTSLELEALNGNYLIISKKHITAIESHS